MRLCTFNLSLHYPKTNGLTEKGVYIAKKIIKKSRKERHGTELYLLNYRNAIVANLNYALAKLSQNRNMRTKLPNTTENMKSALYYNA